MIDGIIGATIFSNLHDASSPIVSAMGNELSSCCGKPEDLDLQQTIVAVHRADGTRVDDPHSEQIDDPYEHKRRVLGSTPKREASDSLEKTVVNVLSPGKVHSPPPPHLSRSIDAPVQKHVAEDRPREGYEGQWIHGENGPLRHGSGVLFMDNCFYDGQFQYDDFHGQGVLTWDDGRKYSGQFQKGYFSGQATMVWDDGRVYSGQYCNHNKHGNGVFTWPDGRRYEVTIH